MAKIKRKRTQFHFSNQNKEGNETVNRSSDNTSVDNLNVDVPDNLFKGVNIDLAALKTNLENEDKKSVKSVRSISKSVKSFKKSLNGAHLKKADKRLLRRNLFLKKIQLSGEHLPSKSKKNNGNKHFTISELDKSLPNVDMVFYKPKNNIKQTAPTASQKRKGVSKAKDRKKSMITNYENFKRLLSDTNFKSDPMKAISDCITHKILDEDE